VGGLTAQQARQSSRQCRLTPPTKGNVGAGTGSPETKTPGKQPLQRRGARDHVGPQRTLRSEKARSSAVCRLRRNSQGKPAKTRGVQGTNSRGSARSPPASSLPRRRAATRGWKRFGLGCKRSF
jgi:hypothetical protein